MEAAAIAVKHPKWEERPLLVIVPREGAQITAEAVRAVLADHVAKWWLPDDVIVVDSLPIGGTGKVLKNELREQFKDYELPGA